ncbi:hypothetical protein BCAR13_440067 [Paraburkholderia caribensis]|nr:hypothetical protein BCAR13_440067 [Paraburkholderia caribensis]
MDRSQKLAASIRSGEGPKSLEMDYRHTDSTMPANAQPTMMYSGASLQPTSLPACNLREFVL